MLYAITAASVPADVVNKVAKRREMDAEMGDKNIVTVPIWAVSKGKGMIAYLVTRGGKKMITKYQIRQRLKK